MQAARDLLSIDASIAKAMPGFAPREEQLAMAEAVEEAIADGQHLVVEAGTGVGKSFAYLVPALMHAAYSKDRKGPIVIATRTIALQEQLVEKDIPLLIDALDLDVKVALAKGRGNYVCLRRLEMACSEGTNLSEDKRALAQLEQVREWAHASKDGSLSDLSFRPLPEVWDAVRAEAGNCLHKRCPHFTPCAYQRSRRRLYDADILVANHALVFADLALREAGAHFLPDYDCLMLDEAHEIEEGAAEYFGARVSPVGINQVLGRFMGARRGSGLFGKAEVGKDLYHRLEAARGAVKSTFQAIAKLKDGGRLRKPGEFEDNVTQPLGALVVGLRKRQHDIEDMGLALEWKTRTDRLEETRDAITLIHGVLDPNLVYWTETAGRASHAVLRAAPVAVAPIMRRALFQKVRSVIMTSATMRVGGSFAHFNRRIGLESPKELGLGSPFNFEAQCKLVLYPNMPDPRTPQYDEGCIDAIRELIAESGGGAFVLFTSYRALTQAYDALQATLAEKGMTVLRQGSDVRTRDIMQTFRTRDNAVLFATDTFWQGVDVRGRNLRLVILTRLPFAVPDHPLQQARIERIEEEGGDAFRELSLPQAVLKLRQGFGRLIRTHKDKGTVAILDPRIIHKMYGRIFIKSLPKCQTEER